MIRSWNVGFLVFISCSMKGKLGPWHIELILMRVSIISWCIGTFINQIGHMNILVKWVKKEYGPGNYL